MGCRFRRELLALRGHSQAVTALAFFPSSDRLASVSLDGKVILWELARTGPEGRQLQCREDMLSAGGDPLLALSISPDGQHLAEAGSKGVIHVWDLAKRKIELTIEEHTDAVHALSYSPNPKTSMLASASADGTVRFWDLQSGSQMYRKDFPGPMRSIAFSASDVRLMAAAGDPRNVTVWSMDSWQVMTTMTGHPLKIRSVAISENARTIATACDDEKVRLWDTVTGQQFYALLGHSDRISAVAFSPDGKTLASCDRKGKILLWKTGASGRSTSIVSR